MYIKKKKTKKLSVKKPLKAVSTVSSLKPVPKKKSRKIVWITSEAKPYAMTGGLADVSGSLPQAFARNGDRVSVIMPYYPQQMKKYNHLLKVRLQMLEVPFDGRMEWAQLLEHKINDNLSYYFVEYHRYYDRPALYDWNGIEFGDNSERFIFLSRAAMQATVALGISPDIIHAHDWHAALACVYLKSHLYRRVANFANTASVLTIHNIAYQGTFHKSHLFFTGLGWEYFNYLCLEFHDSINFLKGGIMTADMISTVSPTHASEILSPSSSFSLGGPLRHRASEGKLKGILNGIDTKEWNPATDKLIPAKYSIKNLSGKKICKIFLQKHLKLKQNQEIPLFGLISRIAYQKGIDIFIDAVENMLLYDDVQFVVLASGDPAIELRLSNLATKYSTKLAVVIGYDNKLSHMIQAGSDFFVMPSRYEPCGLSQIYSMRYGTLPIVRATGGLDDTVANYDSSNPSGSTGFKLWDLTPDSLRNTMRWAASVYRNEHESMKKTQIKAMSQNFSWDRTAKQYEELYDNASRKI